MWMKNKGKKPSEDTTVDRESCQSREANEIKWANVGGTELRRWRHTSTRHSSNAQMIKAKRRCQAARSKEIGIKRGFGRVPSNFRPEMGIRSSTLRREQRIGMRHRMTGLKSAGTTFEFLNTWV